MKYVVIGFLILFVFAAIFVFVTNTFYVSVNFDENGGSYVSSMVMEKKNSYLEKTPPPPYREGYVFTGWFYDKGLTQPVEYPLKLDRDYRLVAGWKLDEVAVSFETNGGTKMRKLEYARGWKLGKPADPKKENYKFSGWYFDPELTDEVYFPLLVNQEYTLYAAWETMEYTATFYCNDKIQTKYITQNAGTHIREPSKPRLEGYTFKGWYYDQNYTTNVTFPLKLERDITLYAKFLSDKAKVTTNVGVGGMERSFEIKRTEMLTGLDKPERDGYTFIDWYYDSNFIYKVSFPIEIDDDITLYAKFLSNKVKIVFNSENGFLPKILEINREREVTAIEDPIRAGYVFKGWYFDNTLTKPVIFPFVADKDYDLFASWEKNSLVTNNVSSNSNNYKVAVLSSESDVFRYEKIKNLEYKLVECLDPTLSGSLIINKPKDNIGLVTIIGDGVFQSYSDLENVVIFNSITGIGANAFAWCTNLENISLGESVISIGSQAFAGCTSLRSIIIPNSVKVIGAFAFGWCSNLESITIGNSVVSIATELFSGCSKLESVIIPKSVVTIENAAFKDCTSLKEIIIPSSVVSIASNAFQNCNKLETVYFTGTQAEWNTKPYRNIFANAKVVFSYK